MERNNNMAQINPYLQFNGNAEEAFQFYKSIFGGEFFSIMRYKDLSSTENPIGRNEGDKIMHISLPIGDNILMASDFLETMMMGQKMENGNRYSVSISAQSKEEADRLFNELSVGGNIEMPIGASPWGSYFAMFGDKYGIQWIVDFDPKFNAKNNQKE